MRKQEEEDQRVVTKYHNEYIKNVVKNVNLAMNYRPGVDDRPLFFFKGFDSEYSSKVKSDLLSRTQPIPKKKNEKKVVLDIS